MGKKRGKEEGEGRGRVTIVSEHQAEFVHRFVSSRGIFTPASFHFKYRRELYRSPEMYFEEVCKRSDIRIHTHSALPSQYSVESVKNRVYHV